MQSGIPKYRCLCIQRAVAFQTPPGVFLLARYTAVGKNTTLIMI